MKVNSQRFGELEIPDKDILHLKSGLLGFPQCKRVAILDHGETSPFKWMLSVDDSSLAFVLIDPVPLVADYPVESLRNQMGTGDNAPQEVVITAITTVLPEGKEININLLAPVVFDPDTRQGRQIVLHDTKYSARHTIALQG